jgi:hypothetical protein
MIAAEELETPLYEELGASVNDTAKLQKSAMATSTKTLTASAEQAAKAVIKSVQVLDATGKLCKSWQYGTGNQTQVTVDVSDLANGIYFIYISNGETTVQKKIVVQH